MPGVAAARQGPLNHTTSMLISAQFYNAILQFANVYIAAEVVYTVQLWLDQRFPRACVMHPNVN